MTKLIKLPVCKVGSFFDEYHGIISFKPSDLDALERNFRKKIRGYEPYARYGHNEKGAGIWDGERAQGHMVDAVREGDVLFGLFTPTNEDVVGEVEREEYRYASPEIIRGARSRDTNEEIGLVLKGVALTNSPNIPNLPRNTVIQTDSLEWLLSDDAVVITQSIEIPAGAIMSDVVVTEAEPVVTSEAVVVTPASESEATVFARAIESVTSAFNAALSMVKAPAAAPTPAQAPAADIDPAQAEETTVNPEDLKKLEDLEAAKLALETENTRLAAEAKELAEAKAALEAEKAELARAAAEAAEAEAIRELEAKEAKAALMLSDRCKTLVSEGVPPNEVEKAKVLITALRKSVSTVMLSDGADPLNLEDAVLALLSDRKDTVKFGKRGVDIDPAAEKPVNRLLTPKAS